MLAQFPETGRIDIPFLLASELLRAAESLPLFENKEFYSPSLQKLVRDHVHDSSPDGFEWLVGVVKEANRSVALLRVTAGPLF